MNKYGFVIPVYNHGSTVESVVSLLLSFGYPVILIDDGNDEQNKTLIQNCSANHKEITLVSYNENRGKGYAMSCGVKKAYELGLTHIFQIDADGQHDSNCCKAFLDLSTQNPDAVINGYPNYDSSAPLTRKNGREVANNWARFVTLNFSLKDVLCGFRIYPVAPYMKLLNHHASINKRMGYDADILVHLSWAGLKVLNLPVNVSYPIDGISNFRIIKDNFSISLTFARLFLGMIIRLPKLIVQCSKRAASDLNSNSRGHN